MIHHLHGKGFDPVRGSVDISVLEKVIDTYGDGVLYTFDDGIPSQILGAEMLKKKGIRGYFFVNHHNEMEQDRATRERLGEGFYAWFFRQFEVMMLPHIVPVTMPEDFLAEFKFYSYEDRLYRYFRDMTYPDIHDIIMKPHREPVESLKLEDIKDHEIGLHSYSHPRRMSRLSYDQQYYEYSKNLEMIPEATTMAHPMGSYNDDTLKILKELGIKQGFLATAEYLSDLEQPRLDITIWK